MKQFLFLLSVLSVVASKVVAQDPIAMDGKEWHIREKIVHYIDYSSDVHLWIAGDTIVDETYCKKLYVHTKQLWEGGEESLEVRSCHQVGEQ